MAPHFVVKVQMPGITDREPAPYRESLCCVSNQDKLLYSQIPEGLDLEENRASLAELSDIIAREGVEKIKGYFSAKLGPDDDPTSGVIQILIITSNILPPETW